MLTKQLLKILTDDGWILKAQKGSHRQMVHPTKTGKVAVSNDGKDEIPKGTLNSISKQAGLK
ncbi:MAG TPA: type II toxin-antitoxin system HicA family toxin [Dyadobacter sp.]|nr:type II toxin-antitoxin system HicA family toxin [Dyadobacter sp.]